MEFWGAEVKSGEPLTVQPGDGMVLHLSQASLGELKKDKAQSVCLSVNIDGKKLVLGTLSSDKVPQQQFDLVFDRDFELSHNWKSGSVYFFGYKATNPFEEEEDDEDDEEESDEDIPLTIANNGKPEAKVKEAEKSNVAKDSASGKQKVKIVEPSKDAKADDEDESTDEDEMSEDEDSDMGEGEDESDGDDESDEGEEETPKKAEPGKKRKADSATKTPVPDKKAKFVTPQKTDGKKGSGHVATPHPSKQAGKSPANKNQQTPKSGGAHLCKTCNRGFGSENALEFHSKAKHSAAK
ncbi:histone deacetylase HDT1-like [Nicotiana tabacum]|uniref:Histone deacetylase HDT1-like n=1 Tax=Nicotiana tabacum TaxID=4097 RepID=E1U7Y2_TOBAC|nr:histone deacetylase HDT1-like [Nicotiana tabacum]ACZ54945.1 type 2 histone deacetylase a [Nicotiana tabacum]